MSVATHTVAVVTDIAHLESFFDTSPPNAPFARAPHDQAPSHLVVRFGEEVAASRQRCTLYGLDSRPIAARPMPVRPETSRLATLVTQCLKSEAIELPAGGPALVLLDPEGVVVATWDLGGDLSARLANADIAVGYCVAENVIGTSAATALVTRRPIKVPPAAHLHPLLRSFATAGVAFGHTSTRRILGGLCLVGRDDVNLSWLTAFARVVERAVLERATRAERTLMDRFLIERRDSRHAVVVMNEQVIITNAAAARIVGVEEQARLWEHARQVVADQAEAIATLEVGRGLSLKVECEPIVDPDGTGDVGVLMRLRRVGERVVVNADRHLLGDLAGSGAKWRTMVRRLRAAEGAATLLVGERGVGKTAVARSLAGSHPLSEIDVARLEHLGAERWLQEVRAWSTATGFLIVRHLELLTPEAALEFGRLIHDVRGRASLVGTSSCWPGGVPAIDDVLDTFAAVVPVAPLRERTEDIPDLVRALTQQYVHEHPELDGVQWMTDAFQTLGRLDWPGNVTSLEALVRRVLSRTHTGYVTASDLPASVVARASRRNLAGLERVEAQAILQAIQDADGNKVAAADALGIARSTLYRKMRALGIDLSSSTY